SPARSEILGIATIVLALPAGLPLFVSADEKDLERPPALQGPLRGSGRLFVSPALPEFNILDTGTTHPALPPRVGPFARVQIEELIPETGSPFGARYLFEEDPDGSYGWFNDFANNVFSSSPESAQKCRLLHAFGARWILDEDRGKFFCGGPMTGVVVAGRRLALSEIPGSLAELRWAGRAHYRSSLSGAVELVRSEDFLAPTDVVLQGADRDAPRESSRAILSNVRVAADRASADVDADRPGHLLFSRTFFRSWKSRLDGAPAPTLVANGRDLAVAVPPGRHHVEFEYDRRPFVRGVVLQLAAFLAIAFGIAATRRRQGLRLAAPSPPPRATP
ncbi:MAG TPA: hypothetical protein VJA66_06895, partial [Thermoanaerobaculia bacterium]